MIVSVIIALIINSSAYVAEIIRSGIQSVDKGQREAAKSLGMSNVHMMTKIIIPQAIKNILPALGNEFITIIKDSSLYQLLVSWSCGMELQQFLRQPIYL